MKNLKLLKTITAGVALALAIYPQAWAIETNLGTMSDELFDSATQDGDNLVVDAGNGVTYSGKMNGDTFVIETRTITKTSEVPYYKEYNEEHPTGIVSEYGPKYESVVTTYNSSGQEIRNVVSSTTDAEMGCVQEAYNQTSVYNGAINANNLVSYTVDDHDSISGKDYKNGKLVDVYDNLFMFSTPMIMVNGIPIVTTDPEELVVDGTGIHYWHESDSGGWGSDAVANRVLPGSYLTDEQYVAILEELGGQENLHNMMSNDGFVSAVMNEMFEQSPSSVLNMIVGLRGENRSDYYDENTDLINALGEASVSGAKLKDLPQEIQYELMNTLYEELFMSSGELQNYILERIAVGLIIGQNLGLVDNVLGIDNSAAQAAYINQIVGADLLGVISDINETQLSLLSGSGINNNTDDLGTGDNVGGSEVVVDTPVNPTPNPAEPTTPKAKRTYYTIEEAMGHVNHTNNNKIIFTFK